MKLSRFTLLLTLVVLLSSQFQCSDGASSKGRRRKKKASKKGGNEIEESVVYSSQADKLIKLAEMKKKLAQEEAPNPSILIALETDEIKLRKDLLRAIINHGEDSIEKASALHLLGRNLYHQQKFELVVEASQEIVRIHEKVDGPESMQVAQGQYHHRWSLFQSNHSQ